MPEVNDKELSQKYEEVVKGIRNEIELMNNFIGQNLYKIATSTPDGLDKLVLENPNAEEANSKKTILGQNNSKEGYSVAGVEENAQKNIKRLKTLGINIEALENIENEVKEFGQKAREDLNSKEGVNTRLNEYIKIKGVIENIGIVDESGRGVADKREVVQHIGAKIKLPESVYKIGLEDMKLLEPLQDMASKRAAQHFGVDGQENAVWCVLDRNKLKDSANLANFTKAIEYDAQAFSTIQVSLSTEIEKESKIKLTKLLLPTISKLSPEELQEKGSQIVKDFAPLLENSNPALVNGAKTALAELDPKYLAEAGETIASNLQQASKLSIVQRIKKIFTRKDYAQENVDKAMNSLKEASNEFTNFQTNLSTEGAEKPQVAQSQKLVKDQVKEVDSKKPSLKPSFSDKVVSERQSKNRDSGDRGV